MEIIIEANSVLLAEFNVLNGMFVGEHLNSPGSFINAYNIRSGNFAFCDGISTYPKLIQKALNHDELVDWVKTHFPNFVF